MTPRPARRARWFCLAPARPARWLCLATCLALPATPVQRMLEAPAAAAAAGRVESPDRPAGPDAAAAGLGPADTAEAAATEAPQVVTVRRGDTLAEILVEAGIDAADAHASLAALTEAFPARHLQPGHVVTLHLDPADPSRLSGLALEPEPGRRIQVARLAEDPGRWTAEEDRAAAARHLVLARGEVRGGALAPSLRQAGLPPALVLSLVRLIGQEVDFQRDLQPGDRFTVLFERFRDAAEGSLLRDGDLVHVELLLSGRRLAWWRHRAAEGEAEGWFDEAGNALDQGLLRTPLDGARMSSGFGDRAHPILGFTRMHRGVDFAAPAGTPVYAAADGLVVEARYLRGYGRTVRLRHGGRDGMETLYAHLSAFARGLKPGMAVRQGEVIGRVGRTGLATGAHLHYEVRVAGLAVDPAKAGATEARRRLRGEALLAFQRARGEIQARLARLSPFQEVAWAE